MKKLSSLLLAGIFTASITACSQETISNVPLQNTQTPNNSVSTYSAEGLKSTFNLVLQYSFKMIDGNKDNFVSLDEYKHMFEPSPIPPPPPPAEPQPPAQGTVNPEKIANQIEAEAKKMEIPTNATERFKKIDKNKDGKISFTEAKNSPVYFSLMTKNQLRTNAKTMFDSLDKDKNKSMSRDEYFAINMANDQAGKIVQGMLFISADKNNNGSLGFSEFEDIYYNSLKVMFTGIPTSQPAPQPVPPTDPVAPPSEPVAPPSEQPAPTPAQP